MIARVQPSICEGSVHIPPSKSMSHRAILCASLAKGTSVIRNVAFSKDIIATIEGMRQLGARITIDGDCVTIKGIADFAHLQSDTIACGESGSTLRFFIPLFSLCDQPIHFLGEGRLLDRPQQVYADVFEKQRLYFKQDKQGIHIKGSLQPDTFTLQGDVSSQFMSGLLFALPLLPKDSILSILPPFASKPYVELTLQMMALYGVHASFIGEHTIRIPGGQQYKPHDYTIEGDYSQLAFFAVLAAINHDLTITGVQHETRQGDKQIISILRSFGVLIDEIPYGYRVHKSTCVAHAIDVEDCPDLGPILCVLGMFSQGETHIYHAGRLRIKESDRIAAMEEALTIFGVDIRTSDDKIWIRGNTTYTANKELCGHNDHRIVMALCIAALCSASTCTIGDAQAIQKSYPAFFDDIKAIQGKVALI